MIFLASNTKHYRLSLTFKNLISSFNLVTVASAFKARVWTRKKIKNFINYVFFILFSRSQGKTEFLSISKKLADQDERLSSLYIVTEGK